MHGTIKPLTLEDREARIDRETGRNLRNLRILAGMSQTDLGKYAGISFQQVQKYENGRNRISVSRCHTLAEALGCTPAAIFDTDTTAPPAGDIITTPSNHAMRIAHAFDQLRPDQQRAIAKLIGIIHTAGGGETDE